MSTYELLVFEILCPCPLSINIFYVDFREGLGPSSMSASGDESNANIVSIPYYQLEDVWTHTSSLKKYCKNTQSREKREEKYLLQ